ncbi:DUF1295-domain-containing protein [Pyrenophora teres f. teres]|uniref:DUF1295-domain-containing protein n=1 Tax=Pyrenophora teres f. teres TaxID=97479 RepID=A0A6S6VHK5_9PLEO|nr:DUF1295-domain-containing protein [Pyrenophora teres f. maculata]CAE7013501.1 DUF1295-domain-containing protein [Pyrenophora teres f. teres]
MPDPRTYIDMALPLVKTLPECADYFKTVEPFLPQLYELPTKVAAHITDAQALKELYLNTNPLISSLAFAAMFLPPIVLVVSEFNRNYSQIDRLWSLLPAFYNIHYTVWAHLNGLPTMKLDHVMAVSVIWSARLTFNYWRKGGYEVGSEDYRWIIVKDYIGGPAMFVFNVTFISLYQSVLLWLITAPTYVLLLASRISGNDVTSYDTLFGRGMLVLVVLEFFADQAQWNFYKARGAYHKTAKVPSEYKYTREQLDRGFNTTGLFAWSRHPNFAAEQAFWVALYQWCCLETGTYANWAGVGALAYLLLFQGSTWLTELLSAGKYPEYKVYQERVGRFLPKFGTKSMDAPLNEKEQKKVNNAKVGKGAIKTK